MTSPDGRGSGGRHRPGGRTGRAVDAVDDRRPHDAPLRLPAQAPNRDRRRHLRRRRAGVHWARHAARSSALGVGLPVEHGPVGDLAAPTAAVRLQRRTGRRGARLPAVPPAYEGGPSGHPPVESACEGGRVFLANQQSAVFGPFSLPSYVLPFWTSLAVAAWMKLFAAAFGGYLLARSIGMRFRGALVCGLTFGFCLFTVAWLPWPRGSLYVLVPWLLLLADLVSRRPRAVPAVGLACVVAAASSVASLKPPCRV